MTYVLAKDLKEAKWKFKRGYRFDSLREIKAALEINGKISTKLKVYQCKPRKEVRLDARAVQT